VKERFDTPYIGFNIGIIMPLIGGCIYYLLLFTHMTFSQYLDFVGGVDVLPAVMSISVIANLAAFYLFYYMKMYGAIKGVIAACILYGLLIFYFKFFA